MSENLDFKDIVAQWKNATDTKHPLWEANRALYWESGLYLAQQAAPYIPPGGRVLDFGAGDGRVSIPLAHLGFNVLAVDSSPEMLGRLKKNATRSKAKLKTALSDGSNLAAVVKPGKVDTVVCRSVLIHHDPESIARLVTQLAGVIKTGGHLIADWPTGAEQVRDSYVGVTVMAHKHRAIVAEGAGLTPVIDNEDPAAGAPSVWKKT